MDLAIYSRFVFQIEGRSSSASRRIPVGDPRVVHFPRSSVRAAKLTSRALDGIGKGFPFYEGEVNDVLDVLIDVQENRRSGMLAFVGQWGDRMLSSETG